ncbi:MAG: hypothetical protein GX851_08155, partial [Clostridiales bacterium]|nr:hypothetical protein [Clostridiales bacterium]
VYCSVCKALGKRYGVCARFILNYDLTFFAVLGIDVKGGGCEFSRGRCSFNPAKKCHYLDADNEIISYAADLAMLMLKHKALDDASDSKGLKRLSRRFVSAVFRRKFRKAEALHPREAEMLRECIEAQNKLEKSDNVNSDIAADPSAKALAYFFERLSDDGAVKRILNRLGYCIGRWVYLADAFDDLAGDLRDKSFNPYIRDFEITDAEQIKEYSPRIIQMLELTAGEAAAAYDLLDAGVFDGVLRNIIYDGLSAKTAEISASADKINKKKKRGAENERKPV